MKILLIGPYPPPHGGISVHVWGIQRGLTAAGVESRVLDTRDVRSWRFHFTLLRYSLQGWTLHLHTNGHNWKSWLLALWCGIVGQSGRSCILTLHSGLAPGYLTALHGWRRRLARFTCRLYSRVICVSPAVRDALVLLGQRSDCTDIAPAYLETVLEEILLDRKTVAWMEEHRPLLSTALFFRPEYGFDLLVSAIATLRLRYPSVGCLVMGSGEQEPEARKRVRDFGLENHILLVGDVIHAQCLALMSRSDLFLRTTWYDADSISVREALALGVPVVASRVGSRPKGVILFQPGDVTDLLSKIESTMKIESSMAFERIARPSGRGELEHLMDIYRHVIAPGEAYVST
jgi:glycosyltransferase involved in cell wall biosynthesis